MGLIKMGLIKMEKKDKKFTKWGYNINGLDRKEFNTDRYNMNGLDRQELDIDSCNINGYSTSGYNSQGYNINGVDRRGNWRKALKKNIPGSGLKILTPQQMLARLPILLAQIKAGNNSRELKSEITQLLYCLYRSKKISKTVYKNLIAAI